jgi:putative RNA 2'-phosphotransferase
MTDPEMVRTSRFLSFVLRHRPEAIGLSPDNSGWARVSDLLDAAGRKGIALTADLLGRIVAEDEKTRYSFSADRLKIRANYGHSIPIDLGLAACRPPEVLYHGTATRHLDSIKQHGIAPRKRRFVHLSVDAATAIKVGRRHGKPAILTIEASRMHEQGFTFYCSESGIWLTERVPAEFIAFRKLGIPE